MSTYPAPYKIALVQADFAFLKQEENLKKAEAAVRDAAKNGAALIVLPEAYNTGYDGDQVDLMIKNAETEDGKALMLMRKLANELNVFIVAPIYWRAPNGNAENRAFLINDTGNIVGAASKTHPVGDERTLLQRGKEYPVFETKLGRIGMLVCYDSCFPETSRMLVLGGTELLIIVSAWRGNHYFTRWIELSTACRALDNLVFVAHVNRVGKTSKDLAWFAGTSQVYDPLGQLMGGLNVTEEAILYTDIDLSRLEKDRAFNTVLEDRHPEDYGGLAQAYFER